MSAGAGRGSVAEYGIPGLVLPPGNPSHMSVADSSALRRRRVEAAALADELRALIDDAVATEVSSDRLAAAAELIATARSLLNGPRRSMVQLPLVDDLDNAVRMYNPVCGHANPIAPPMTFERHVGGVVATCTLGLAYEGPPMFGHGGASALLLDQLLSYAAAVEGCAALTTGLRLRYLRPVPLQVPLRLTANSSTLSTGADGCRSRSKEPSPRRTSRSALWSPQSGSSPLLKVTGSRKSSTVSKVEPKPPSSRYRVGLSPGSRQPTIFNLI